MPRVAVANIAKGKDPDTDAFPSAEFPLDQVQGHKPYTMDVPDVIKETMTSTQYFEALRMAWDTFRNRLITIRINQGHDKQRKDPEEKKV